MYSTKFYCNLKYRPGVQTLFSDGSSISTESKTPPYPKPPATTNTVLPFKVILAQP